MPLVRVSLREGKSALYRAAIGEAIHQAMVETINVPADDRFQTFTEHPSGGLVYDKRYLGIERTDGVVFIQITLNTGRTLDQKRALYRALAEKLARDPGLRKEDLLVSLVEVPKENWSFGNGEMSYVK
ncbi:MAG TPA: tautomerase family protein [Thermoanaerobaculia bacterium]|jgi:4-oxalocrotonate tautomerase|nr:tautomerase family protein [Thermoanaerobaculia bacterium]